MSDPHEFSRCGCEEHRYDLFPCGCKFLVSHGGWILCDRHHWPMTPSMASRVGQEVRSRGR